MNDFEELSFPPEDWLTDQIHAYLYGCWPSGPSELVYRHAHGMARHLWANWAMHRMAEAAADRVDAATHAVETRRDAELDRRAEEAASFLTAPEGL
tara:strand:- start:111 stop:398 length:288 start_codon:yes stop_codon:yes gene_type:complete